MRAQKDPQATSGCKQFASQPNKELCSLSCKNVARQMCLKRRQQTSRRYVKHVNEATLVTPEFNSGELRPGRHVVLNLLSGRLRSRFKIKAVLPIIIIGSIGRMFFVKSFPRLGCHLEHPGNTFKKREFGWFTWVWQFLCSAVAPSYASFNHWPHTFYSSLFRICPVVYCTLFRSIL